MKRDSRLSMTLHLLVHLADEKEPVTSERLAERHQTHPVVIRRMLAGLRKAQLVSSEKGHGGGWKVDRDLKEITLKEIYEALGEPVLIASESKVESHGCLVEKAVQAELKSTYQKAEKMILERFSEVTLDQLVKRVKKEKK